VVEGFVSDVENDLRSLSEDLAADARRLASIEEEKGHLHPANPRVARLAREAERISRMIVPKAVAERELADEASGSD
jgi:hypothetical protein